jgi:hypothetical protein
MAFTRLIAIILVLSIAQVAYAQTSEVPAESSEGSPSNDNDPSIENPYLAKLEEKTSEITEGLGETDLKAIFYIREAFGLTEALKHIRVRQNRAVQACSKENPSLAQDVEYSYDNFWGKLEPELSNVEQAIDSAIKGQKARPAKEIREYLATIKKATDYKEEELIKLETPVTTEEACLSFMDFMKSNSQTFLNFLREVDLLKAENQMLYERDAE